MISEFFIHRPVLTSVVSIFITLAGILAILNLPVAQFPEITPPQVVVQAIYPGASSELVEKAVATPIEAEVNGTENMLYMNSISTGSGMMTLTATFEVGTNIDLATINISNSVKIAEAKLPDIVKVQGITVKKRSSTIALIIAVKSNSKTYGDIDLSNYASINLLDEIKRVDGVGDAVILGAKDYSMRIWMHPDKLSAYNLTSNDVINAINEQNKQYPVGRIGELPTSTPNGYVYSIQSHAQLTTAEEFGNIILKVNEGYGSTIKIKDIARVELGSADYTTFGKLNDQAVALIAVYPQPNANLLKVVENTTKQIDVLSKNFPSGIEYAIPYDTTKFVKISIKEAVTTLFEAVILVFLVVYLFLQNFRATLIPCIAVPVSIIGTFSGIYLLGFSINTLTLFGLVLAIGIVIDDAIVVLENVERIIIDEGLSATDASIKAMHQVTSPIITIVLVLCAVFIPVGFLGGLTGQLYKQFAVTITISVIISGIVALTLTPMLCSKILDVEDKSHVNKFFLKFNSYFEKVSTFFSLNVRRTIKYSKLTITAYVIILIAIYGLYHIVPKSFIPEEDQGFVLASVNLPDASSLISTQKAVDDLSIMIREHPAVKDIVSYTGFDILSGTPKSSSATVWVTLKDWSLRKSEDLSVNSMINYIMLKGRNIKDAFIISFNMPSIPGLGTRGGLEFYIQNKGDSYIKGLDQATNIMLVKSKGVKEILNLNSSFRANVPQLLMNVDNEKVKSLGLSLSDVYNNLSAVFSSIYINDFYKFGKIYHVLLQADSNYRSFANRLNNIYFKSVNNEIIPANSVVRITETKGLEAIEHFNGFLSSHFYSSVAPKFSDEQGIEALQEIALKNLGNNFSLSWVGETYQAIKAGDATKIIFLSSILVVFLILAAQYENWVLPFTVILSIPFTIFGALLTIFLRQTSNDIYFQIGIITLIGLGAKNAILIVEFANIQLKNGVDALQASVQAIKLRFRPIIMTSLAFILGVLPLVLSSGAGANSRHSIGTGVFGGMLISTLITVIFVPFFYNKMINFIIKKVK